MGAWMVLVAVMGLDLVLGGVSAQACEDAKHPIIILPGERGALIRLISIAIRAYQQCSYCVKVVDVAEKAL